MRACGKLQRGHRGNEDEEGGSAGGGGERDRCLPLGRWLKRGQD